MKKFFASVFLCCIALFSGILLSACGEKEYFDIKIQKGDVGPSLYEIVLKKDDGEVFSCENDIYTIKNGTNLRVEIYATKYSINFENFSAKIGEKTKNIIKNADYNPRENLFYGYFLIANLKDDLILTFDGASSYESSFEVVAKSLIDEETKLENEVEAEKLKAVSVCFYGSEYVNLYDYLTSDAEKSFIKELKDGNTFRIKLDGQECLNVTANYPFTIAQEGKSEKAVKNISYKNDYYLVDLGEIESEGNYTIFVDFSNVEYNHFSVVLPTENLTYSLELSDETLNYSKESTLTLTKLLEEEADYNSAKAYLNGVELEKIESEESNKIKFKIPSHITPFKFDMNYYEVTIKGIIYNEETYSVKTLLEESSLGTKFNYTLSKIDEDENVLGVTGIDENGGNIAISGEKNMLHWSYVYDQYTNGYYTDFDLYNYDIYLNGEQIMNLAEVLSTSKEDIVANMTDYIFKAYYNENTNKYDEFKILFTVNKDMEFLFKNFTLAEKQIGLSYNFDDERVAQVQAGLLKQNENVDVQFETLTKGQQNIKTVKSGDKIVFRLILNELVGTHEFKLKYDFVSSGYDDPLVVKENGALYVEYYYIVSNLQTFDIQDFELVSSL